VATLHLELEKPLVVDADSLNAWPSLIASDLDR
jgi:hypothetical protein